MTFNDLNLIAPILRAVKEEGYETPTPIQQQAIPSLLEGKDLLGCAQTGTGKTAAFAIPIIQLLHNNTPLEKGRKPIRSLILTPTRELAIQINESFAAYGKYAGLKHTVIFGGVSQHGQTLALRHGVDILVATPGRLLDLINQGFVHLEHISLFVLDEADRMLDMGFVHDVKKILTKLPRKKQSLFFSATMPPEISKLASTILHNPVKVEVTPVASTADTIQQKIFLVDKGNKKHLLIDLLKNKDMKSVLVFTRTKHGADKVVKDLIIAGFKAAAIHGNKSQNARQNALNDFKNGKIRTLVATDIAARGIDIDELSHVVNYEMPNVPETYVHRIGRTGRAGSEGVAYSFCDAEEKEFLKDIQKLIGKTIPVFDDHQFPMKDFNPTPAPKKQQGRRPQTENRRPQGNSRKLQSESRRPQGDSRRPNTGETRRPQTENKRPQGDNRRPQSENRRPETENKRPQGDGRKPNTGETRRPISENKKPQGESRKPQRHSSPRNYR